MVLLMILLTLAAIAIAGTLVVAVRDGYRRIPRGTTSTLEA
jgi:hypothetical protein